jgi:hypothetical protein
MYLCPSGLRKDAQAALDYLLADNELSQKPIVRIFHFMCHLFILTFTTQILYGHSLGGAVAIDLASRNPSKVSPDPKQRRVKLLFITCSQINALIVQNTFTSLPDVVRGWPTIGIFSFICLQKWNSASKLPRIPKTLPILMLSGDMDQVVPREHMHTLWEIAKKRGGNDKDSNGQTDIPPSKDVFRSFMFGSHGERLFVSRFREVLMCRDILADTDHQAGYWHAVKEFLDSLNTP